jgi:pimeloyl-ACP methyl ester carboxylesterase
MVLVGTTADAGRVRDVAGYLASLPKGYKARLCGSGNAGVIAAYAALLVPDKVAEVILHDPPTTHDDGPHFLNVRRVLDIPDALGLLAPDVKVTLVGKTSLSKAFDKTEAIFKLAGTKGKLKRE